MRDSVNRNPSREDLRSFGLVMLCGLGVIGGLIWCYGGAAGWRWGWQGDAGQRLAITLWGLGAAVTAITLTSVSLGRPIYVVWMTAAMWMGMVMVPVFLTVLFVVLLPVFSLIRFADPLRMKLKKGGTYWEDHAPHEATLERMRRPF